MKQSKQYVAVLVGHETGDHDLEQNPTDYKKFIGGFQGSRYKFFSIKTEAIAWLEENKADRSEEEVFPEPQTPEEKVHGNIRQWKKEGKELLFCFSYVDDRESGGWRLIHDKGASQLFIHGGRKPTSRTRADMYALLNAMNIVREEGATILSMNLNLVKTMDRGWLDSWASHGWKKANGRAPNNVDLWQKIYAQAKRKQVKWVYLPNQTEIYEYGDPIEGIKQFFKKKGKQLKRDEVFVSKLKMKTIGHSSDPRNHTAKDFKKLERLIQVTELLDDSKLAISSARVLAG